MVIIVKTVKAAKAAKLVNTAKMAKRHIAYVPITIIIMRFSLVIQGLCFRAEAIRITSGQQTNEKVVFLQLFAICCTANVADVGLSTPPGRYQV